MFRGLLTLAQCIALDEQGECPASPLAEWLIGGDWSLRAVRSMVPAFADGSRIRLRPVYPNQVWSFDCVEEHTHDGRRSRLMTLIDEFSRR